MRVPRTVIRQNLLASLGVVALVIRATVLGLALAAVLVHGRSTLTCRQGATPARVPAKQPCRGKLLGNPATGAGTYPLCGCHAAKVGEQRCLPSVMAKPGGDGLRGNARAPFDVGVV
ncbi:hypothetical protein MKUB_54750 [Mycobacterium kubicae]|uniref:Secreted protein n=1 Tax=Mycobacterium kubicae TaxID=120959 RepID=A0AAX1J4J5_9MYCO|nr:hypothetical protein [Mycobacterium kubicae]MCV7096165.1 hypothetical protein [Mycobacterium kubicae]QNI12630.1 hypothetical protein GAN18_16675 [Mycobacterium kubicae]QPI36151.1 hypothetical protein I2456_16465 [Mycobacterium kubicae]GFG67985.1 hypothetical protein MKUB_54750 [Mycobacterium kubicae]